MKHTSEKADRAPLAPLLKVTSLKFHQDLRFEKTGDTRLSCKHTALIAWQPVQPFRHPVTPKRTKCDGRTVQHTAQCTRSVQNHACTFE